MAAGRLMQPPHTYETVDPLIANEVKRRQANPLPVGVEPPIASPGVSQAAATGGGLGSSHMNQIDQIIDSMTNREREQKASFPMHPNTYKQFRPDVVDRTAHANLLDPVAREQHMYRCKMINAITSYFNSPIFGVYLKETNPHIDFSPSTLKMLPIDALQDLLMMLHTSLLAKSGQSNGMNAVYTVAANVLETMILKFLEIDVRGTWHRYSKSMQYSYITEMRRLESLWDSTASPFQMLCVGYLSHLAMAGSIQILAESAQPQGSHVQQSTPQTQPTNEMKSTVESQSGSVPVVNVDTSDQLLGGVEQQSEMKHVESDMHAEQDHEQPEEEESQTREEQKERLQIPSMTNDESQEEVEEKEEQVSDSQNRLQNLINPSWTRQCYMRTESERRALQQKLVAMMQRSSSQSLAGRMAV
jgi:hypothetical protein